MAGDTPQKTGSKRSSFGRESDSDTAAARKPRESPRANTAATAPTGPSRVVRIELNPVQESPADNANKLKTDSPETLTGKLRKYGYLQCSACTREVTSTSSYYLHLKWCGRESETSECPGCRRVTKSMWMKQHKRVCKIYKRMFRKGTAPLATAADTTSEGNSQAFETANDAHSTSVNTEAPLDDASATFHDDHNTRSDAADNSNELEKCSVCSAALLNLEAMKEHYMEQHTLVWSALAPQGRDDCESLEYILKTLGSLKCQKCQRRLKSARYYRFHAKWCGRKNELQTCNLCHTAQPAIMLRRHQKVCRDTIPSKRRRRPSSKPRANASETLSRENTNDQQCGLPIPPVTAELSEHSLALPVPTRLQLEPLGSGLQLEPQEGDEGSQSDAPLPMSSSTPAYPQRISAQRKRKNRSHAFHPNDHHDASGGEYNMLDGTSANLVDFDGRAARGDDNGASTWDDLLGDIRTSSSGHLEAKCHSAAACRLPLVAMLEINKLMASHGKFTYYCLIGGKLVIHPESGQNIKQVEALQKRIQLVLANSTTFAEVIATDRSFNASLCGNGIGATLRVGGCCQTVGLYVRHKGVAYFVTAGHCFSEEESIEAADDVPVCMSSHPDVPGVIPGREEVRLAGQFRCFRYDPLPNAAGQRMLNHVDIMICPMPSFYTEFGSLQRGLDLNSVLYPCRVCYRQQCTCGMPRDVAYTVRSLKLFDERETVQCCEGSVCMLRAEELMGETLMCCPRDQQVIAGEVLSYGNAITVGTANGRLAVMNNVLLIKPLCRVPPGKGDSGSVWVNPKTGEAVAITCAMGEGLDADGETTVSVWLATLLHACLEAVCCAHQPTFNRVEEFKALAFSV